MRGGEGLRAEVLQELKDVRRRGIAELEGSSYKKRTHTKQLEAAARTVPGYHDRLTRIAAISLLLRHEIAQVDEPHRSWLEVMFGLREDLQGSTPTDLRNSVADSIKEDRHNFSRPGGKAEQALTLLAIQIAADCFPSSSADGDSNPAVAGEPVAESPHVEPAPTVNRRRIVRAVAIVVVLCVASVAVLLVIFDHGNTNTNNPGPANSPDAAQLEHRYDGKDPRGIDGTESQCADPPPSQLVTSSHPPVFGVDGRVVGSIELRTSPICPVIWARVIWNGGADATYRIPSGWTLHMIAHRPETKTSADSPVASIPNPIPYGLSTMLATVRGCVYVEVYFSKGNQQTAMTETSCVTH
jgi:hypothetical protein